MHATCARHKSENRTDNLPEKYCATSSQEKSRLIEEPNTKFWKLQSWKSRVTIMRGFPGQRPSRVCFYFLRNHTSVVLYLSYATKTTEKQLLILEFHMPRSP
jgi:hypothetical protein